MGGTAWKQVVYSKDVICSGYRKESNMGSWGRLTVNVLDYVLR